MPDSSALRLECVLMMRSTEGQWCKELSVGLLYIRTIL
jgi:hypothetical protein